MKIKTRPAERVSAKAIMEKMTDNQAKILANASDLIESFDESARGSILLLFVMSATKNHTEDLSLAVSLIVTKIVGHWDGDREILKSVLESVMSGIVEAETQKEKKK